MTENFAPKQVSVSTPSSFLTLLSLLKYVNKATGAGLWCTVSAKLVC